MIKYCLSACLLVLASASLAHSGPLAIANRTTQDIINILVTSGNKEVFLRLDLMPGASGKVDNPDGAASLRVDTGLQFWDFTKVDLANAKKITFCAEHPVCLIYENNAGKITHIAGSARELVPQRSARPVCNLDNFHPAMPMKEVCAIIPAKMPHDDNGALLTGMGFAGMAWAARLVPTQPGPATENSFLEHLELRRPLSRGDLAKLIDVLFKRGYTPWQAEFPGLDMEFDEKADAGRQKHVLLQAMDRFIQKQRQQGHKDHAKGEKCEEASVILAPRDMLQSLENSDDPTSDVQIFTIILRPCADTMILDVAAYRGKEPERK